MKLIDGHGSLFSRPAGFHRERVIQAAKNAAREIPCSSQSLVFVGCHAMVAANGA